jgi:hypothetical protein
MGNPRSHKFIMCLSLLQLCQPTKMHLAGGSIGSDAGLARQQRVGANRPSHRACSASLQQSKTPPCCCETQPAIDTINGAHYN